MDIDQLRTFERVVREGSFSRAARSLDISQPTISARIQALEQEVGGALLQRGGRTIALTERGESFLPYARQAIAVLSEGIEAAQQTRSGRRGRISIGTMPSLAGSLLSSTIERFHRAHPQVELFVETGHSYQITAMLMDGIVKLGLISYPFFNPALRALLRFREPIQLMVAANHSLAGRGQITLEELRQSGEPIYTVRWGPSADSELSQLMRSNEPPMHLPIDTVRHLLLSRPGAAWLTRTTVAQDIAAGRIVPLTVKDIPASFRDSVLVQHVHSGPLSSATRKFIDIMQEVARESSTFLLEQ
ncbi:MAG: LysR family transcriptional regulator [Ktedonobacteraceae bacterium]|nr:LysR family transcriptional regulator [Ktedonobacteraceae bacterium]